jgi:hypothetical protein
MLTSQLGGFVYCFWNSTDSKIGSLNLVGFYLVKSQHPPILGLNAENAAHPQTHRPQPVLADSNLRFSLR